MGSHYQSCQMYKLGVHEKLVTMYSNYLGNIFQGNKSISKGLGEIAQ